MHGIITVSYSSNFPLNLLRFPPDKGFRINFNNSSVVSACSIILFECKSSSDSPSIFSEIALAYSTASDSRYKLYSNLAAEKGISGCLSKNLCTSFLLMVVIMFHNLLQQWQITTSFLYSLVIAIQFFIFLKKSIS